MRDERADGSHHLRSSPADQAMASKCSRSPRARRESLYVMAIRGREVNRLWVQTSEDTHPDTAHLVADDAPSDPREALRQVELIRQAAAARRRSHSAPEHRAPTCQPPSCRTTGPGL